MSRLHDKPRKSLLNFDMPWTWSKASQLLLSLFVALVVAVLVFHHGFHQPHTLFTIEVGRPAETVPNIGPLAAGAFVFLFVASACYAILRVVARLTPSR